MVGFTVRLALFRSYEYIKVCANRWFYSVFGAMDRPKPREGRHFFPRSSLLHYVLLYSRPKPREGRHFFPLSSLLHYVLLYPRPKPREGHHFFSMIVTFTLCFALFRLQHYNKSFTIVTFTLCLALFCPKLYNTSSFYTTFGAFPPRRLAKTVL